MKKNFKKLSHTLYQCKYHIVFCPKYRRDILKNQEIRDYIQNEIYKLIGRKDKVLISEINIQTDHVHMILDMAPKHSVSEIMGYLKGKLAIRLFQFAKIRKLFWGRHLWSRGYCVSTVGLNESQIRKYVKWQDKQNN